MTKLKIGIFGSAAGERSEAVSKAQELGTELGRYADSVILVNGICGGIPLEVMQSAKRSSPIEIHGYSSCICRKDQLSEFASVDLSYYSRIQYMDKDSLYKNNDRVLKKYRNLLMVARCDAGIVVSGRWGTLNEFTCLVDMGKVIGILRGSGGVADQLPGLIPTVHKSTGARIFIEDNPALLVKNVLHALQT